MNGAGPTQKVHGTAVLGIPLGHPGSGDRVEHTIRHFLSNDEFWDDLGPRGSLKAMDVRNELEQRKIGRGALGTRVQDAIWWRPPRVDIVERAHAQGYYPRYTLLIEKAGAWQTAGSKWVHVHGSRYTAQIGGYIVAGDLDSKGFAVRSAYRSVVTCESSAPRSGLGTLRDVFSRVKCQDASRGSSRSPGDELKDQT